MFVTQGVRKDFGIMRLILCLFVLQAVLGGRKRPLENPAYPDPKKFHWRCPNQFERRSLPEIFGQWLDLAHLHDLADSLIESAQDVCRLDEACQKLIRHLGFGSVGHMFLHLRERDVAQLHGSFCEISIMGLPPKVGKLFVQLIFRLHTYIPCPEELERRRLRDIFSSSQANEELRQLCQLKSTEDTFYYIQRIREDALPGYLQMLLANQVPFNVVKLILDVRPTVTLSRSALNQYGTPGCREMCTVENTGFLLSRRNFDLHEQYLLECIQSRCQLPFIQAVCQQTIVSVDGIRRAVESGAGPEILRFLVHQVTTDKNEDKDRLLGLLHEIEMRYPGFISKSGLENA